MSQPTVIEVPHNTIVKIGTNVNRLRALKMEGGKSYYETSRPTGEAAPALPINPDNPRDPITTEWLVIPTMNYLFEDDEASDIYIYCTDGDSKKSGYLRVK